jgi:hypothetical protein
MTHSATLEGRKRKKVKCYITADPSVSSGAASQAQCWTIFTLQSTSLQLHLLMAHPNLSSFFQKVIALLYAHNPYTLIRRKKPNFIATIY